MPNTTVPDTQPNAMHDGDIGETIGLEQHPDYVREIVGDIVALCVHGDFSGVEDILRVSKGEVFVLKLLLESAYPLSPTCLAKATNTTKGRISAILNKLESKGEILRQIDPNNRRSILVSITDVGEKHAQAELIRRNQKIADLVECVGAEDAKTFVRVLDRVCQLALDH